MSHKTELKKKIRLNKLKKQRYRCYWCKKPFIEKDDITLDHIIPKSKGGTLREDNIVVSCRNCNTEKGNTIFEASHYSPEFQIAQIMKAQNDEKTKGYYS